MTLHGPNGEPLDVDMPHRKSRKNSESAAHPDANILRQITEEAERGGEYWRRFEVYRRHDIWSEAKRAFELLSAIHAAGVRRKPRMVQITGPGGTGPFPHERHDDPVPTKSWRRVRTDTEDEWPEGVSDGLILNCSQCHEHPAFDYQVTELCWERVVPKTLQHDVICLPCLDRIAYNAGIDITPWLLHVQFTGVGKTVIMNPKRVHRYGDEQARG